MGDGNLYPWAAETYTLQPWVPFENWINGLMQDPDYSDFQIPGFEETARALQALTAASVMAFNPFTAGSPFCPGQCTDVGSNNLDYINMVRAIDQAWPGNETIGTWLDAYDNGTANVPTEDQIQRAIEILQQGYWSFGNPSPDPGTGPDYTDTAAQWYQFWTSLGFDPSNNPAAGDLPANFAALAGAFSPEQLADNWSALAGIFGPAQVATDWATLADVFDPAELAVDWASLVAAFDPASIATDWAAMLAGVGL